MVTIHTSINFNLLSISSLFVQTIYKVRFIYHHLKCAIIYVSFIVYPFRSKHFCKLLNISGLFIGVKITVVGKCQNGKYICKHPVLYQVRKNVMFKYNYFQYGFETDYNRFSAIKKNHKINTSLGLRHFVANKIGFNLIIFLFKYMRKAVYDTMR